MTKDELKQYRNIVAEIEGLTKKINENTVHSTVTGSDKNFPYIQHTMSVSGVTESHESDLIRRRQFEQRRDNILRWVRNISDKQMRDVITLRYITGNKKYSWTHISMIVTGGSVPGNTLRMAHERFLEKN